MILQTLVSLRRKKHTAQKSHTEEEVIAGIANMDETGSSFIIEGGKTYDSTGAKDIWCNAGQSGLDKRQYTIQVVIYHCKNVLVVSG